jgi:hypothetical protein
MDVSDVKKGVKRVKEAGLKFLTHGTAKGILEFLLILGTAYFFIGGGLILVFKTDSYWMAVTSDSMKQEDEGWRRYYEDEAFRKNFLISEGMIEEGDSVRTFDTSKFPIQGGFERGDLLIIQGVSSVSEIEVGDVLIINRDPYTIALTHRVLAVRVENGGVRFTTKGDKNPYLMDDISTPWHDDGLVLPERITGKVIAVIPEIGNIPLWFQGR